jgi:hypothetical protein
MKSEELKQEDGVAFIKIRVLEEYLSAKTASPHEWAFRTKLRWM